MPEDSSGKEEGKNGREVGPQDDHGFQISSALVERASNIIVVIVAQVTTVRTPCDVVAAAKMLVARALRVTRWRMGAAVEAAARVASNVICLCLCAKI